MENSYKEKFVTIFFVLALATVAVRGGAYGELEKISSFLGQKKVTDKNALTVSSMESDFSSNLWLQRDIINLNGLIAKKLDMHGFYSDMGLYITSDNYIVSSSEITSTDYEVQETEQFYDFLKKNNVNFLYVNEPTKYTDDALLLNEFGVETYSNRNMDRFLNRISNADINYIDLRENIKAENLNVSDLFYRTDHHWTTPAGLWASKIMAEGLNKYCGYKIDTSIYNIDNYDITTWKDCWLGEQGRKVAETYVGRDDYTEVRPKFKTNFSFKNEDGTLTQGTFDNFINEGVYNLDNDVYENGSWHYSYRRINCINNNVKYGKLLIVGDSFEHVTQPFLALGVHEVDSLILRDYDDSFSLKDYILENGYDTVMVAYTQFMLGAHDDVNSANYRMFTFE